MKNRKVQNEKRKVKPPAATGKKKRPATGKKKRPACRKKKSAAAGKKKRSQDKAADSRGHRHKSEIEEMQSPALVQMMIRAAVDYSLKPQRKTERLVTQTARQLLIRLGHNRKEAKALTDMIMEQMQ